MRTIVIGDIHGCFREFQALLQKVKFDRESDRLILLGDVIDRGPDSAMVLQECQILKRDMGERFIQLLGNHEDMMLDAYASFDRSLWNYNGGSTTRKNFYKYNMEIPPVLAYLRTLPLPARRAFLCRYYYADSLAETARVCGISVPAVKSQLYRTRQGLRTYLEKEGFDE